MADSERHVVVPQLTNLPHIWDSTCLLRNHVHGGVPTTTWQTLDLLFPFTSFQRFLVKKEEKFEILTREV